MRKVVIVGSGIVGLALAEEVLSRSDHVFVSMIESGGKRLSLTKQRLNTESKNSNILHKRQFQSEFIVNQWEGDRFYLNRLRFRMIGGTANFWGGECLPPNEEDLERPSIYGGWPIKFGEILKYLISASNLLGLDYKKFVFTSLNSTLSIGRWQYVSGLGNYQKSAVTRLKNSNRFSLITGHTVFEFEGNENNVTAVISQTDKGEVVKHNADIFIVAAGGLENANLILESKVLKQMIPSSSFDNIGRFFSEIPHGFIASISPSDTKKIDFFVKDTQTQIAIKIKPGNSELIPASVTIKKVFIHKYDTELFARNIFRKIVLNDIKPNIILDVARLIASLFYRLLPFDKMEYKLWIICAPNLLSTNQISLEADKNFLGLKRMRVSWQSPDDVLRLILNTISIMKENKQYFSIADIKPLPSIFNDARLGNLNGGAHHLCTTRMSADPNYSAVNSDCLLNGTKNFYVAGSSVFALPFPGNSTLLSIALALRLAKHIGVR